MASNDSHCEGGAARTRIVVIGLAKLPGFVASARGSDIVSVELEVEPEAGTVVEDHVQGIPPLGTRLVERLLTGRNMEEGPQTAIDELASRYLSPSRYAVCAAVANAYEAWRRSRSGPDSDVYQGQADSPPSVTRPGTSFPEPPR